MAALLVGSLAWSGEPVPATAPAAAAGTTWTSWRGGLEQTGLAPGDLGTKLERAWSWSAGEAIVSSAVVDETSVYVGIKDGRVVALDRAEGTVRWTVETEAAVEAPGLLAGDLLIIGSRDRKLRALERATGKLRWAFDAEAEVVGAAVWLAAARGRPASVLIGAYDGRLHLLDAATGEARWTYETGSYLYGSAAVRGDKAVIGGCDGFVHAVNLADGKLVSKVPIEAYVGASVAWPADDQAYVGHFGNAVIRFDPGATKVAWSHVDRSFAYLSSPAVTDELVILGGRDRVVRALERSTGELWWLFPTKGKVDSSPVVVGDKVVVGSADGRLYVLTREDGELVTSYDAGEPITASPAVAGGMIYVGTEGGTMLALRSSTPAPPTAKRKDP